jgi:hypothetical protein
MLQLRNMIMVRIFEVLFDNSEAVEIYKTWNYAHKEI